MNGSIGRILALGMAASLALNAGLPGWAEALKSTNHPVNVQLKSDVWGSKTSQGQAFIAELGDDLYYKNWSIPAGTTFRGEVTKVRHSRHFGRPGYVVLNVEEAELPNGAIFAFDSKKYEPCKAKIHHKTSLTATQTAIQQLPSSAVGLAVTLPLTLAAGVSGPVAIPIGFGARVLAGSGFAVMHPKNKNKPVTQQVTQGAIDGSGIPRLVGFLNKYPEPEYKAGELIPLHFNPKGLEDLFVASAKVNPSQAMPLEPTDPVAPPSQQPNLVKSPKTEPTTATFP